MSKDPLSARTERAALVRQLARLEREARPLDPGPGRRRQLQQAVHASAERFLGGLAERPVYDARPDPGLGLQGQPIGAEGRALREVISLFEREVVAPGALPPHPAHLAYIPGGALYHGALADYLAAVSNKYSGIFFSGPGAVRMENMVVRWAADLLGLPAAAGGSIASGGSLATLTAITAARDARELRGRDYAQAVVYLTAQTHHCVEKALRVAGMGEAPVRIVPLDERFRMQPAALAAQVAADRRAGLRPWLVVATAGTTDTGAVDPLDAVAEVAAREGCWFHVDAAYGGFFLLTARGRALLRGVERADSVVLDPHKSLFLPWGAGMVLVRDRETLLRSNAYHGSYMQDALREPGEISPADVSPELSRPFRALRIWLPLMLLGTRPFAAALEEKLLLARYFRREVEAAGFEVGPEPDLSIVTFRWAPAGMPLAEANVVNQRLVDALRQDGRVFLSSTMLDGRFTLRMAALSLRTHRAAMDRAVGVLRERVRGGV